VITANLLREFLQPVFTPRRQNEVHAQRGQLSRKVGSNAGRCARDQRPFTLEILHCSLLRKGLTGSIDGTGLSIAVAVEVRSARKV
jgi:hypothetical protein